MKISNRYGPWALVTGASSGIGEAFARRLAADGFNVVLTARRKERIDALAEELRDKYGGETRSITLDLARHDSAQSLAAQTEGLDMGLLVNNAGFGAMGRFGTHSPSLLVDMINLNCTAPVLLAHFFLPRFRSRPRSAMIMVSSVAAYQGSPYMACYSATKAFDLIFGEAVAREFHGTGVDILVVSPGATETEFSNVAGAIPRKGHQPESVVDEALSALGQKHTVVAGISNKIQVFSVRLFPRRFVTWAAAKNLVGMTPPEKR